MTSILYFTPILKIIFSSKYLKFFIMRFAFSLNLVRQLYLLLYYIQMSHLLISYRCLIFLIAIGLSSKERPNDVRMKSLYTK